MEQIIKICREDDYSMIEDFRWYIRLLAKMIHEPGIRHAVATLISDQLIDVTVRVPGIRDFSVSEMERIFLEGRVSAVHSQNASLARILYAAGYIVGEFSQHVNDYIEVAKALMKWQSGAATNSEQAPFIQSALKVVLRGLGTMAQGRWEEVSEWKEFAEELLDTVLEPLNDFSESNDLEVQERACSYLFLLDWCKSELASRDTDSYMEVVEACQEMFETQLIPVDPNAQKSVAIPKGIDLDEWIYEPPQVEDSSDSDNDDYDDNFDISTLGKKQIEIDPSMPDQTDVGKKKKKRSKAERRKLDEERKARQEDDPYYLTGEKEEINLDEIGIEPISFTDDGVRRLKPKKISKKNKRLEVLGVVGPAGKKKKKSKSKKYVVDPNDPLAHIDLSMPLGDDEVVPIIQPYEMLTAEDAKKQERKKRKRAKKEKKEKRKKDGKKKRRRKKDRDGEGENADDDEDQEEGKVQPEATVSNDLLDFGAFGLSAAAPSPPSAPPAKKATISSNALDIFGDLGGTSAEGSGPATAPDEPAPKKRSPAKSKSSSTTSYADGKISLKFGFKASSNVEKDTMTMNISVQNSSSGSLKSISLQISSSSFLKPSKKKLSIKKLKKGSKEKLKNGLKVLDLFSEDQDLKFTVKAKTSDGEEISDSGTMTVPIKSILVQSKGDMTKEAFREMLMEEDGFEEKASIEVDVSLEELVGKLEEFGFTNCYTTKKVATFHSGIVGGRQCAVYAKKLGEGGIRVDLKTESEEFATGLLSLIEASL